MEFLYGANIINTEGYHVAETVLHDDRDTFLHTHDFFEVFVMLEGEMTHICNQKQTIATKGDLCLVHPEDVHCFRRKNGKTVHFINLAFPVQTYERALCFWKEISGDDTAEPLRQAHLHRHMAQAVSSRMQYLMKYMPHPEEIPAKSLVMSLLLDAFACLQSADAEQTEAPAWLEQARRGMQEKENFQLGLERFVELSGRTQEHLTRTMKKYYRITPSAYVNHIRLEHAAALLRTTDESVLNIMLECGFNNVSYFNQRFREEYIISPSQYRRFNRLPVGGGTSK